MILEQNRMLVEEISQNQENRDIDGLTRNAELIRQVNVNIAYMFDLYSDISGSFADYVAAKKATNTGEHNASDSANP
ncbi:hypothetical protein PR202_ga15944 [Eleusine coracana subsp. coracana]|uniref:Protein EARLY FLOWERING 4 domain-containing protein n=1 Tax=Eleusine coracana subsp. coracana TaxID=191504 RepID=A0AAV5CLK6_ELECO|nr:hypothetical protein PR202_ga15944 [Eleusine coracana subsp. coracana]